MHYRYIMKSWGRVCMLYSFSMLFPLIIAYLYHEPNFTHYIFSFIVVFMLGLLSWLLNYNTEPQINPKEIFFIATFFWLTIIGFGVLPFIWSKCKIDIYTAIFESFSGLTATGATCLSNLEQLPKSLIYYRQQLQFLGGSGIVLLATAILPIINIPGIGLFNTEPINPSSDNQTTLKISKVAKSVLILYLILTALCTFSYWLAGMPIFDAVNYSFGTVSTGGFAPHDASIGYFNNTNIKLICCFYMFFSGINFFLHFNVLQNFNLKKYVVDQEFMTYLCLISITTIILMLSFHAGGNYLRLWDNFVDSLFNVVSFVSTTGLSIPRVGLWPIFVPTILLIVGTIGGCTNSTSGGLKNLRLYILFKHSILEIKKLIHPQGVFTIKYNNKVISESFLYATFGHLTLYIAATIVCMLMLQMTGLDLKSALSAAICSLSNVGSGFGSLSENYSQMTSPAKLISSFAMLFGRLELFSIIILFMPSYWRK